MNTKIVVVLGMHRSGTSAIAAALEALGVFMGQPANLLPARPDNPEGFWEHKHIVTINDKILARLGRTWDTPIPMPHNWWIPQQFEELRVEAIALIKNEFCDHPLWGWKDPRTSLLLPFWQDVLAACGVQDLLYILPIRSPSDVAASLSKRNGFTTDKSFLLWQEYTINSLEFSSSTPRIVIDYNELIDKPIDTLQRICQSGGNTFANSSIVSAIATLNPGLRHNNKSSSSSYQIPQIVQHTYDLLLHTARVPGFVDSSEFNKELAALSATYKNSSWLAGAATTPSAQTMQVFWAPADSGFSEQQLAECNIVVDGRTHEYVFTLPEKICHLRIDPTNRPAQIEIVAISLEQRDHPETAYFVDKAALRLAPNDQLLLEVDTGHIQLLVTGYDPQIVLRNIAHDLIGEITLRVTMRMRSEISPSVAKLIRAVLHQQSIVAEQNQAKVENEIQILGQQITDSDTALAESRNIALARLEEVTQLSHKLDTTESALASAQKLALDRYAEVAQLSNRLNTTESALGETQKLALDRFDQITLRDRQLQNLALARLEEVTRLSQQLDATEIALGEAQKLALERFDEIVRLIDQSTSTNNALSTAQQLALARYEETAQLSQKLDATESALASAQKLALDRYAQVAQLSNKLNATEIALGEAQRLALERFDEITLRNQQLADREVSLRHALDLAMSGIEDVATVNADLANTGVTFDDLQEITSFQIDRNVAFNDRLTKVSRALEDRRYLVRQKDAVIADLATQVAEQNMALREALHRVEHWQLQHEKILISRTWRWTQPLRSSVDLLKTVTKKFKI